MLLNKLIYQPICNMCILLISMLYAINRNYIENCRIYSMYLLFFLIVYCRGRGCNFILMLTFRSVRFILNYKTRKSIWYDWIAFYKLPLLLLICVYDIDSGISSDINQNISMQCNAKHSFKYYLWACTINILRTPDLFNTAEDAACTVYTVFILRKELAWFP